MRPLTTGQMILSMQSFYRITMRNSIVQRKGYTGKVAASLAQRKCSKWRPKIRRQAVIGIKRLFCLINFGLKRTLPLFPVHKQSTLSQQFLGVPFNLLLFLRYPSYGIQFFLF